MQTRSLGCVTIIHSRCGGLSKIGVTCQVGSYIIRKGHGHFMLLVMFLPNRISSMASDIMAM